MASTRDYSIHHTLGSTVLKLLSVSRRRVPFSVRVSAIRNGTREDLAFSEAPSCIFVGSVETASRASLEALYRQARDAYYSGKPLIVDAMFDRVELKLRSYGSKSVVKYPRCSLRRQSAYADAEEDVSQLFALASIWILFLAIGCSACILPVIYSVGLAYRDSSGMGSLYGTQTYSLEFLSMMNGSLLITVGSLIGFSIMSSSVKVLLGLWKKDLVALKGACPNCGEEVFAFVNPNQPNYSAHRADCHVCESSLVFRTKVEQSISRLGRRWVYGRTYLASTSGSGSGRN